MKSMETLMVLVKAKLEEVGQLFADVVSQIGDKSPYEIVVGKNDSLIVRVGKDYWACPLTSKECEFLSELLQRGGRMDGNNAKQWGKPFDDHVIWNIHKSISRKLAAKKMPVRLHFIDWVFSIEITPF